MFKNRVRSNRRMIVIAVLALFLFSSIDSAFAQGPDGDGSTATDPALRATCGVYPLDGEEGEATTGQAYTSTEGDVSDICVINGGTLTVVNPTIIKSGDTTSADSSSFYGLNAAVLVGSGSQVTNIIGNGYTVYYDGSVCTELGGGYLQPAS